MKGSVDNVKLAMMLQYALELNFICHIFNVWNWVGDMMLQVSRVMKFEQIDQERYSGSFKPSNEWPEKGHVSVKDISLRYRKTTPLVLQDLSFDLPAGKKLGIVGRTGAGKSTISAALSRIVELQKGSVEIDGVDISKIDLIDLRSNVTQIPQDPTLFRGSIRYNLDPFNQHSDLAIETLLKKAGLEKLLSQESKDPKKKEAEKRAKDAKAKGEEDDLPVSTDPEDLYDTGIYFKITEGGNNLSVGERQLVCICRAILREAKVVILDEATANIDVVTEQTIQTLINTEFKHATMIVIAHRINTIINSDYILVLGFGKKLEYDSPANLMANPNSHFAKLL